MVPTHFGQVLLNYAKQPPKYKPAGGVIEAYKWQDPPPPHKLAVPVAVVNHLVEISTKSTSDKLKASCDMATIAFYFLL